MMAMIIMHSFVCYFSKLEHIAHYKAKNQNKTRTILSTEMATSEALLGTGESSCSWSWYLRAGEGPYAFQLCLPKLSLKQYQSWSDCMATALARSVKENRLGLRLSTSLTIPRSTDGVMPSALCPPEVSQAPQHSQIFRILLQFHPEHPSTIRILDVIKTPQHQAILEQLPMTR